MSLAFPVLGQSIAIDHDPVTCVVADAFPRLEARFAAEDVASARVLFKAESGSHWYGVVMNPEGAVFAAVLPRPQKTLKAFRYYIETVGRSLATNRTSEYTSRVVPGADDCKGEVMGGALASAMVLLQVPAQPRSRPGSPRPG